MFVSIKERLEYNKKIREKSNDFKDFTKCDACYHGYTYDKMAQRTCTKCKGSGFNEIKNWQIHFTE